MTHRKTFLAMTILIILLSFFQNHNQGAPDVDNRQK
jgi:hypothetical protein